MKHPTKDNMKSSLLIWSLLNLFGSSTFAFHTKAIDSPRVALSQYTRVSSSYTSLSTTTTTTTTTTHSSKTVPYSTQLNSRWYNDEIEGPDRIKACVPYMLPLLDGDYFGKYIYQRIPPLNTLDQLFIAPMVETLQSFPFLSIILFLILSLGTRNPDMSRSLRFNAQQAVLIDIGLIFPTLFVEAFKDFDNVIPRSLAEMGCNFVWYAYMSAIVYSCYCNLTGKKPDQIPFISGTAEMMVGPI